MSAPSKEEIARIVGVARDEAPLLHLESYNLVSAVIVSLAEESGSRHVENKACDDTIVMLSRENERLRAERAECLEAFEALQRMAKKPMRSWETGDCIDARQVDELCEEMLTKLRGKQP